MFGFLSPARYWDQILNVLGAGSALKIQHSEPGMGHQVIQPEIKQMIGFIRGGARRETN